MTLLIYGAYGYTGELVAREAVDRGLEPVLAGRDGDALRELGRELQCAVREFRLDLPSVVVDAVRDADVVLNCAGPFAATATQLADACLETRTDYLDVTGEMEVFEALAEWDAPASDAGVTLLPGVGFDVVPTDCLAARLVDRLPTATHLELGFDAAGGVSRGTARTAVRGLGEGTAVRERGELVRLPMGARERRIDFGRGERSAIAVPWGDLVTAAHTTGVGNVTVYAAVPPRGRRLLRLSSPLAPVLRLGSVRWLLDRIVAALVDGPDADERAGNAVAVWGEARDDRTGETVTGRLRTPDPYAFTADAAASAAERTLAGNAPDGYATPAGAFGAAFVDELAGVEWIDRP